MGKNKKNKNTKNGSCLFFYFLFNYLCSPGNDIFSGFQVFSFFFSCYLPTYPLIHYPNLKSLDPVLIYTMSGVSHDGWLAPFSFFYFFLL